VKQPLSSVALSFAFCSGGLECTYRAAQDLVADGITVNMACPGSHDTDRMKALVASGAFSGRLGDPADFGKVVAFLCSEPAKFVSGVAVQVDGAGVVGLL
jgi:3-oxoacyl-[acyl-carrier protein] reductase